MLYFFIHQNPQKYIYINQLQYMKNLLFLIMKYQFHQNQYQNFPKIVLLYRNLNFQNLNYLFKKPISKLLP